MKWSIVTDTSCDYVLDRELPKDVSLEEVPFIINVGDNEYIDTNDLDVLKMLDDMESYAGASRTNCPAPGAWYELFEKADNIVAITISANLSGSYNSAESAKKMILEKYPEKNIYLLNSRSAGSVLSMYLERTLELIDKGCDFDAVVADLEEMQKHKHTIFALASFNNLVKNGRVSKVAGFIAGKLGIWGIGIASSEGTIIVKEKTRGEQKILASFINDMKENGFSGGYVIISHCQNPEMAKKLHETIVRVWKNTKVKILKTGGLCSFYAERRGMIVAY